MNDDRFRTTRTLSMLVEKRLANRCMVWGREVSFDRYTPDERRVDYVGFDPEIVDHGVRATSLEFGRTEFYEVKSCMDDVNSGHGLTFYGDENWLVTTPEVAERMRTDWRLGGNFGVLVPSSDGSRLHRFAEPGFMNNHRTRSAGEILLCILKSVRPMTGASEMGGSSSVEVDC